MKAALSLLALVLAAPVAQGQFGHATNNGAITVTNYTGAGGVVIISNFVSSIGRTAFAGASLANLVIPASVTNIAPHTFYGCVFLTNATLPDGLLSIGESAFWNCRLTNLTIPGTVTSIGSNAFGYDFFATFSIPASVTSRTGPLKAP